MRVTIYGLGVVGGALYRYLKPRGHEIVRIDPGLGLHDLSTHKPDAIFICVPVPTKGFKQDLSIVEGILAEYQHSDTCIFMRSTVLPGTADKLSSTYNVRVISCPEFLTERKADRDTASLPILYGRGGHQIMGALFPEHARIPMENSECEMAKYAHNCFGALKVTYFNGIHDLCEKHQLSYERVLQGVLASGHINRPHTQVPGPDGEKGYGGKCFPKDMEAFVGFNKMSIFGKMILDAHCMNRFYRGLKPAEKLPEGELGLESPLEQANYAPI
jgi:UDP-glucose 6-dehydrogenase